MNSETMNGTIRSMLGTMLQHLSALPVHMLRQVYVDHFWILFQAHVSGVFLEVTFCIFNDFWVSMGSKIGVFLHILCTFQCLGDYGKTVLSLQSQHDSAGSRASPNHTCSMFFKVMILNVFFKTVFF